MPSDPVPKLLEKDNTSSSPAPPLDLEDVLQEILLRLPPQPSSLPRASALCKRWRIILSDTRFLSYFRKHHQSLPCWASSSESNPPLLGNPTLITSAKHDSLPILDIKPDCIPAERFSVPKSRTTYDFWRFLGCRHGLAVLISDWQEVVVWDPLTGQQHCVPFPPGLVEFTKESFLCWHAAVLCADTEDGHVHGDCFSRPFKLVLTCSGCKRTFACLYESASGVWGHISSMATSVTNYLERSSILIGNALFWMIYGGDVLAFDIERQSLGVIKKPADAHATDSCSYQLLRIADDSAIGLAVIWKRSIQLWERKSNYDGVVEWVLLQKTFQLDWLFPRGIRSRHRKAAIVGYDEETQMWLFS